ncbi:putative UDP-sugar transporter-like isoform 2 [Capsicum annuum]|nr:putative UDP-sugar transporter-like isoform 2 [Capsicum annuum]
MPPHVRKMPGRPGKNKNKEEDKTKRKTEKLFKRGIEISCNICHSKDHNKRKCPIGAPAAGTNTNPGPSLFPAAVTAFSVVMLLKFVFVLVQQLNLLTNRTYALNDSLFSAFSYGVASMAMVFINKAVIMQYAHSMTLLTVQQIATALLIHVGRVMGYTKARELNAETAKRLFPVSLFYNANVGFALASLKGVNIPMYIAIKRLTPLAVLVAGFFTGKAKPTTQIWDSLDAVTYLLTSVYTVTLLSEKITYRLAKARERKGRDLDQVKCIKGEDGRVLVEDVHIKKRWRFKVEEVSEAIRRMRRGRASGPDKIPVDFWKYTGGGG